MNWKSNVEEGNNVWSNTIYPNHRVTRHWDNVRDAEIEIYSHQVISSSPFFCFNAILYSTSRSSSPPYLLLPYHHYPPQKYQVFHPDITFHSSSRRGFRHPHTVITFRPRNKAEEQVKRPGYLCLFYTKRICKAIPAPCSRNSLAQDIPKRRTMRKAVDRVCIAEIAAAPNAMHTK